MADKAAAMRKFLSLIAEEGNPEVVEEIMERLMRRSEDRRGKENDLVEQAKNLKAALEQLQTRHKFRVGQLVQWKRCMKNRRRPSMGEPAIVVEVLEEPVFDTSPENSGAATPYFREPLDIQLGILDEDGDFSTFHFDSRRFEPFEENPEATA